MPETDPYEQLAADLRDAKAQVEKARKVHAALEKKTVRSTDDDKIVTAIANGSGQIVDLSIDENALKYPERLGSQITLAIMRARKTAQTLTEKAYAKYLPDLPSPADLKEVRIPLQVAVDYHLIDYGGPAEIKNEIAERMEALQRLEQARLDFKERRISQTLSSNAGIVEINLAKTYLRIDIKPDAPKMIGLERLAKQIIASLALMEVHASEMQSRTIDAIQINGESLGERLRAPKTE
jgi:DNA-binding protein YbaB